MRKFSFTTKYIAVLFLIVSLASCQNNEKTENTMQAPKAKKVKHELTKHGQTRIDNYFWLNKREDPEVVKYLNEENAYTAAMMKHTDSLQEKLYQEMIARLKQDDATVPYLKNGYYYYNRYEEGKEYPIYCRKKGTLDAVEEVLIDENKLAEGHSFCEIGGLSVSPDNKLLAYGVDTVGRRNYTISFIELATGKEIGEKISITTGGVAWANDNKTVFYTRKDEQTLRSDKIYRHKLGQKVEDDKIIFHEKDETFYTYVTRSLSGKYIIIGCESTMSSEFRILSADKPEDEFKIFEPRQRGHEYSIEHAGNKFVINTNLEAKNFRLMETPENKTTKENWKEIIAHRPDVFISDFNTFKNFLVINEQIKGLPNIRIINYKTKEDHYINFGEETYVAFIGQNAEFETNILRFDYSSITTPFSTFDYNMETKVKELKKQQPVLGSFDKNNYEAKRLYVTAKDGTKVPISLVSKKGLQLNGNNPLLLYSYGSYGSSSDPYFSSSRLSLLDRGFVFAIAHIRGGQEMGREWYENGKLLKKKNTFTDFNDCAEFLINQKYTSPDKLFALGGSAGGLLMGAIVNMRPDLYKGVIAAVPFVDVVTTMLDETIPLTTGEYDEWGNPNEKEYYDYMLSYSPYDNVEAKNYPAMLVTTGLHDSQVQYWEPAKWVAKLREMKTDKNKLLLYCDMESGHGGASGRFKPYRDIAREYTFFLDLAGIKE